MELFDGKYKYVKELGEGAFGSVFLAEEDYSDNLVAIKKFKDKNIVRQRAIVHEMQIVSKFNHPNIVSYKHSFFQDGFLFLVMEYCQLGSLNDFIQNDKIIEKNVWEWVKLLADTMGFVHSKGIIHHDIKPANILFTEDGTIKITDFGVANTNGGTKAYMSPESLKWMPMTSKDARVDVYSLGVTLLELLTRRNPFIGKSVEEILEIHNTKEYGTKGLPIWQQEVLLKAISETPELRFQNMKEFCEAITAKAVPIILDKDVFKAGEIADKAKELLKRKKWQKALILLEHAEQELKPSVNVMIQKGRYHLLSQDIIKAKGYFEKALKNNPRLDVHKELGWINLEQRNYPVAISLISDYLHRNPSDPEAYNLLLECYYHTNRYETAIDLGQTLLKFWPNNVCFSNNLFICYALQNCGASMNAKNLLNISNNVNTFLEYNLEVINEIELTHNFEKAPTLKSKLLFMDYRFLIYKPSNIYCTNTNQKGFFDDKVSKPIIKFGRFDYDINDVKVLGGTSISRRHCVIINYLNDIWLCDLASVGTFVNGERLRTKIPLIGKNTIKIGTAEFEITNDKSKLF